MAGYALCGSIVAQEGRGGELAALLLEGTDDLDDTTGCRLYLVNRDREDPDKVWIVEVWDSQDAHAASLELPAVQATIARARPIIAAMGERFELEPLGGKGAPT